MEVKKLLEVMHQAEKLKDTTRHCWTTKGRHESVADHTYRAALMAYFMKDEFPDADMNKVITMCLIHDLGESFTGDIPSFLKSKGDEAKEEQVLQDWVMSLPSPFKEEMTALYQEMNELATVEAKIYKAIDNMEAVIQHNESDLSTWIEKEFTLNLTYGDDKVAFSPYLSELRRAIRDETEAKINKKK